MSERLEDKIKRMIVDRLFLTVSPESIGDDDNLMEALGLDSIRLFEITIGLESEFELDLSKEDFDIASFSSVAKLSQVVRRLKG
jgi:acyl carrier protein